MISIIVPVYNVAPYLPQCLESLVGQTYRDIEIICVNDGSSDGSLDILESYAQKDKRIRIINQENQGLSGARNTGIAASQGEWVMFVDSDDWIDLHCCEEVIKYYDEQIDLYIFSYVREYAQLSRPRYVFGKDIVYYQGDSVNALYARLIAPTEKELHTPEKLDCLSTAWGKLYKASIIKQHQLAFVSVNEIGTEDLLFNVYYFTWVKEAVYLPFLFYHYRNANISSLTKLYKPCLREQWECLFQRIEKWIFPLQREDLQKALAHRRALSLIGQGLNITFSPYSFVSQYSALSTLLNSAQYKKSIRQVPMRYFPIHWKVFFLMARYRITIGVLCLLRMIKIMINR